MRQQKVGYVTLADVKRFPPHIQAQVYRQLEEQGVPVMARAVKGEKPPRPASQRASKRNLRREQKPASLSWRVYMTIPVLLGFWWIASVLTH